MEKYKCTVCNYIYDSAAGDSTQEGLPLALLLPIYQTAGLALNAEWEKICLKRSKEEKQDD